MHITAIFCLKISPAGKYLILGDVRNEKFCNKDKFKKPAGISELFCFRQGIK
jgi:hypothetical protein